MTCSPHDILVVIDGCLKECGPTHCSLVTFPVPQRRTRGAEMSMCGNKENVTHESALLLHPAIERHTTQL
jgi:hypothetical protein